MARDSQRSIASGAAYGALALEIAALVAISSSDTQCTGSSGSLVEPGNTIGVTGFVLAPILAIVALVLLARVRRAGGSGARLATAGAIIALPLACGVFYFWVVASSLACGFF